MGSSLGHCEIYIWAAASETEDRYTVSHMVTSWQRPYSIRSLVWTTSVGPGYSVRKKKKKSHHVDFVYLYNFNLNVVAHIGLSDIET